MSARGTAGDAIALALLEPPCRLDEPSRLLDRQPTLAGFGLGRERDPVAKILLKDLLFERIAERRGQILEFAPRGLLMPSAVLSILFA